MLASHLPLDRILPRYDPARHGPDTATDLPGNNVARALGRNAGQSLPPTEKQLSRLPRGGCALRNGLARPQDSLPGVSSMDFPQDTGDVQPMPSAIASVSRQRGTTVHVLSRSYCRDAGSRTPSTVDTTSHGMGAERGRPLLVSGNRPDHLHTRMAEHQTDERGTGYSVDYCLGFCCVPFHRTNCRWSDRFGNPCNHVISRQSVHHNFISLCQVHVFSSLSHNEVSWRPLTFPL